MEYNVSDAVLDGFNWSQEGLTDIKMPAGHWNETLWQEFSGGYLNPCCCCTLMPGWPVAAGLHSANKRGVELLLLSLTIICWLWWFWQNLHDSLKLSKWQNLWWKLHQNEETHNWISEIGHLEFIWHFECLPYYWNQRYVVNETAK